MSKQPQQQVVRIESGEKSTPLSKNQKAFNRLTKRIADQEKLLVDLRKAIDTGRQRIQTDLTPLRKQFDDLRADMVRLFDAMNTHHTFTKAERRKLVHLITDISYELIQKGYEDLKAIHDRYDEGGFEAAVAESDQDSALSLKMMAEMMLGIEFDPEADLSSPDQVRTYIAEQLRQRAEAEEQRRQEAAEHQAQRPKSEKQQAREAKKQAEQQNTTKAVRALYMDLVKAFHPDREPDDAEKERKTAIMQRVTAAYEKSDLMALFRLQLEFERIDQAHLEKLANTQLQYYNKILKEQAEELDQQLFRVESELNAMTGGAYGFGTAIGLEYAINADIKEMKRTIKLLKADLTSLTDPAMMKAWLKTYRIPREADFPPMGFSGGFGMM